MPVELLEAPIDTSISTIPKSAQELGRSNISVRRFLPDRMKNEFDNRDKVTILNPRSLVIEGKDELAEEFNRTLEVDFEYYARTRDLEIGTKRADSIQGVVDRLTRGTEVAARVVIMRRGKEANAFVTPEGTIFVSQSLLNKLDSMDEIAAVLAHEVGHLINKTAIRSAESGASLGIGWVHEAACDLIAPQLLEKAGFSSWAFSTAIEKIQGYERGDIHQSGLSRASQSTGSHLVIDRTTSNQIELPIPDMLQVRAPRTSFEIVMDRIEEEKSLDDFMRRKSIGERERIRINLTEKLLPFRSLIEQLHPRDFRSIYQVLVGDRNHSELIFQEKRVCDQLIRERLEKSGYSKAQINLFLIRSFNEYGSNYPHGARDAYMFQVPHDLVEAVDIIASGKADLDTDNMYNIVFESSSRFNYSSVDQLLMLLAANSVYDVNFENKKEGLPVDRDVLLDSLEKISALPDRNYTFSNREINSKILARYIGKTFLTLSAEAGTELDESQIEEFFKEVKERGIKIDLPSLVSYIEKSLYSLMGDFPDQLDIFSENRNKVIEAAKKVFETAPFILITEYIDQFFGEFRQEGLNDDKKKIMLDNFLKETADYFKRNSSTEDERDFFARYLNQKIESTTFKSTISWFKVLADWDDLYSGRKTEINEASNDAIRKFNLQSIIAVTFFNQDSDKFYEFVSKAMEKMVPVAGEMSRLQLVNLCRNFFTHGASRLVFFGDRSFDSLPYHTGIDPVNISDHSRLFGLSLIKRITNMQENLDIKNLADLITHIRIQRKNLIRDGYFDPGSKSIYNDRLVNLILEQATISNFEKVLESGLGDENYYLLFDFLQDFYPDGPQKDQFLREINRFYLRSPNVNFETKVDYLLEHFNRMGPEGMVLLAEQIQDIETYRYFREKCGLRLTSYLDNQELGAVNIAAHLDLFTSYFVKEYGKLLQTCQTDPEASIQISTDFADKWFRYIFEVNGKLGIRAIEYDKNQKKFTLTEEGRQAFRSAADSISTLQGLSDLEKFAILHKSLTDVKGALTSTENRKKLAGLLTGSLKLSDGFISAVLTAACIEADAKLIGFPASVMMIPLIFKALNAGVVDINKLAETIIYHQGEAVKIGTLFTAEEITSILNSDTRSMSVFGAMYQNQPDSYPARLAKASDGHFVSTTVLLERLLTSQDTGKEKRNSDTEIDPATEAVIRAVETSGALGIRALQLATQFYSFPPALEKRLSETFDSNPGMNKLIFWENLNKTALDEAAKGNHDVEQFLQRITLGDYLGGGSLQTTYAAILDAGTPNERRVIVKMKNPNVEKFIEESYKSAQKTLEAVSKKGGSSAQHARVGIVLFDLSQKWCIEDLNDKTYIEDDDQFRDVIAEFNQKAGQVVFYAPEKIFTSSRIKSEDEAEGKTANQFLNDPDVSFEQKQTVVRTLGRFFAQQLKGIATIEEGEKKLHLVHSDPHIGNYMVDVSGSEPRLAVIDRSMYLKLADADIKVLEKLVLPGNDNDFVYSFIDRILDVNKVRGVQRQILQNYVMVSVGSEYKRQQVRGEINRFDLMRTMISTLSDSRFFTQFSLRRMEIPTNLRLMIRNIGAFQELGRRYGVDFEQLYKKS